METVGILLLIFGAVLLAAVGITFVPIRRDPFTGTTFVIGWLTGELAGQLAALDLLTSGLLVSFGATSRFTGKIGAALAGLALVGLIVLVVLGRWSRIVVRRALAATPEMPVEVTADNLRPRWGKWWRVAAGMPIQARSTVVTRNVDYVGDGARRHRLDIYRPREVEAGAPVLIYVHGGAWVIGDKREQGRPMMFELAARGWVCVAINYRLSPAATWPDHIVDVMSAIRWVKEHIAEFGGDPSFVALAGGSAGGHLAALAALSAGEPTFQPGFEDADTSVNACIPIYGVLDMTCDPATSGRHGPGLRILLEHRVFKRRLQEHREDFEAASPFHRIHEGAPPFLVVHGSHDTLVPVAVPRAFVPALRAVSRNPVAYVELPMAQHAFDVTASPRTSATTAGVVAFLDAVRSRTSEGSPEPGRATHE
jgi:acetyl esterase/lipase